MAIRKEHVVVGGISAILLGLWLRAKNKITGDKMNEQSREQDPSQPDVPEPSPGSNPGSSTRPPDPIAVGVPGKDAQVDALLSEMDAYFQQHGVRHFTALEVTLMRKTPSRSVAIPPRAYWGRMLRTLLAAEDLRSDLGMPLHVIGGFRPSDYNKRVGGAAGSRHQWFEAIDALPQPSNGQTRKQLALAAAKMHNERGTELKMGLGVYGGTTIPNNIHMDTGHQKRTWANALLWKKRAAAAVS